MTAFTDRKDICIALVAARITGTRPEDFRDFTEGDPPYTIDNLYRFLAHHHIRMGLNFIFDEPERIDLNRLYVTGLGPIGACEAVLTVAVGSMPRHCIYFDGASVYDPIYRDRPTPPVSRYRVRFWSPIFRMEQVPRP